MLVAAVGAGAFFVFRPDPPINVETVRLVRGRVREVVPSAASGEVVPARRVTIRAEMAGTVSEIGARAGARVKAKDVIVSFQSDELAARRAQAKANVDAAHVAVSIAKGRHDAVARAHDRAAKLHQKGAASDVDLERATTEKTAAAHAVEQAEAALAQAKAAQELASIAVARSKVTAPFDGVLQEVFAELGVQATPGAPLFDLIDDASVRIQIPVDEADIARIAVGQTVFLHSGSHRDEELSGKVVLIPPAVGKATSAPMPNPLQDRERAFFIEVVPDDPKAFFVGSSVAAEFLVSERDDVLFVPTHLVLGTGLERAVFRIHGGKAERSTFKPGLTSWERTEVVSGLEGGDEIVSNLNVRGLEDGVPVKAKLGGGPEAESPPPARAEMR